METAQLRHGTVGRSVGSRELARPAWPFRPPPRTTTKRVGARGSTSRSTARSGGRQGRLPPHARCRWRAASSNFGSEASDYPETSVGLNYTAAKGRNPAPLNPRASHSSGANYGITVNTVWPVASTPPHKGCGPSHNPRRRRRTISSGTRAASLRRSPTRTSPAGRGVPPQQRIRIHEREPPSRSTVDAAMP